MGLKQLLQKSREIWGEEKLNLSAIIVRLGKVFGDICRVIFSTIRRCDDLGYDPEECINKAIDCQKEFKK